MPQLPGTIHDRIGDLRAQKDLTLKELAERIGVDATTLGRVERGETHRISDTLLIALATEFGVSADFLLGLTDLPDRKNYDIGELGLSTKAARVLYARQADTEIVNRLLESPRFPALTRMIAQYFDDTSAVGFSGRSQVLDTVNLILSGYAKEHPEYKAQIADDVRAIQLEKVRPHELDMAKIQNSFSAMLKEIKKDMDANHPTTEPVTKVILEQMMAELNKGNEAVPAVHPVAPEQITHAILSTVEGALTEQQTAALRELLLTMFLSQEQENPDAQPGKR